MTNIKKINIEISEDLEKKINNYLNKKRLLKNDWFVSLVEREIQKDELSKKNQKYKNDKFTIALISGGPSQERGISLNSARSIMDHLDFEEIETKVFYIDQDKNAYKIKKDQLYSNTPSDFDFKLHQLTEVLTEIGFINELKKVDLVFPLIHGDFGEDGVLQELLERNNIPYIGSGSLACQKGFNKIACTELLRDNGFFTFPFVSFVEKSKSMENIIERFFVLNKLKKAVVKPANGGSSIGVYCVYSFTEAIDKANKLIDENLIPVIIEPFCKGKEFTTVILQHPISQKPVALIPSEVDMQYDHYQIFDYRRKYLPTQHTRYHTPARFTEEEIAKIQKHSEDIFKLFDFKDFIRMDGWLLDDGRVWFSDINIASGMEQNSFIFQQGTRLGLNHLELINYIIRSACNRQNIACPKLEIKKDDKLKNINVIFGGDNAERQVSLISGTNVWLKLQKSFDLNVKAFLLDKEFNVWYLPYMFCLNHTMEEIFENCENSKDICERLKPIRKDLAKKLDIKLKNIEEPIKYSFNEFVELCKKEDAFVFLGLHGGKGEDGTIQKILKENGLQYNGSDAEGSQICMDKYQTGEIINALNDDVLISAPKIEFNVNDFVNYSYNDYYNFWDKCVEKLSSRLFIIKPARDGSSSGAVKISDCNDLKNYVELLKEKAAYIPYNTFKEQKNIVEMPSNTEQPFLLEAFIDTDEIFIKNNTMKYNQVSGWLELTVGVIESEGKYHSFNPSITIAANKILTIEEKFQGGTGINLTPPPLDIINQELIDLIKTSMEKVAKALKIKNYARIDIFVNIKTKKIIVIEANSLPALTPSTVLFHQALNEEKSMKPRVFLESLIK